jgi:uroporphyrin-III C-methyltransferase
LFDVAKADTSLAGIIMVLKMNTFDFSAVKFVNGTVWLVGAGPGDPGLLTLHAANAMRQADVIVHDALVSDEVLALAGRDAVLESVGKRGGRPSPKQAEICQKLIDLARQGKRVLRLKGGDPFVFGRGAEEVLALVEAGIEFRVIPGITAGIGGLAYAGIPVTHGAMNQSVTFLTGHDPSGDVPDGIDWQALAKGSQVLVLYMAVRHMPSIAKVLMDAGRDASEPVAFVRNATMENQQVHETELGKVGEDVGAGLVASPSIVVIGEVVNLRRTIDWWGQF